MEDGLQSRREDKGVLVDVGDDAAANLQMVVSELGYGLPSALHPPCAIL
jgi:hypothetical protein